jgi:hypothetical protein
MLHYNLAILKDEDFDLGEQLYQLERVLNNNWPEDSGCPRLAPCFAVLPQYSPKPD